MPEELKEKVEQTKVKKDELSKLIDESIEKAIKPLLEVDRKNIETDTRAVEEKLFPTLGNFLKDVVNREGNEEAYKRVLEYRKKELSMDSDPEGGYMVPTQFREGLLQIGPEEGIVRPRAFVIPAGNPPDAALDMPYLEQADNSQGSHGDFYGGIWFGWTAEGATKTNTEIKVGTVEYKPNEWSGYCVMTDKIMRNAAIMEAITRQKYKNGLIGFEDYHFLRGTGVGQPLGVINSPATISVTRGTALHIYYSDICNMMDQFIDSNKAIWVINKACRSEIMNLKDDNSNNIFIQGDISKKIPDTLAGMPVKFTYKVPTLGTKGDIGLYDFSKYVIKDGYGPAFDISKHVYFLSNRTCLKMFGNVDGKPWLKGSLTADDNSTEVSPFVVLTTKLQ